MEAMSSQTFNFIFKEIADPRVYNWLFMSDPWIILVILMFYLYGIYVFFPRFMDKRKPYHLKGVVRFYNLFQITANALIVYGLATAAWKMHYTCGCQLMDYSEEELSLRMASIVWWVLIIKLSHLIETVLYILRKKYNQFSILHVYHHVSTVLVVWSATKYFSGGMAVFSIILNCSVHVLMYTYYFLASFGPKMQNRLKIIKSKLTLIQIIQLFAVAIHSALSLLPYCEYTSAYGYLILPDVLINICFFLNFYVKSYNEKKKTV